MSDEVKGGSATPARRERARRGVAATRTAKLSSYVAEPLDRADSRRGGGAASRETQPIGQPLPGQQSNKPIVVGVDGSRFSRQALRWALAEATRRDCVVRALMVTRAVPRGNNGRSVTLGIGARWSMGSRQRPLGLLNATVHSIVIEHDGALLDAELISGSAPEVLSAASADAQLLVLGSHGQGQLLDTVLGSVSRYCVRHAHCPVVVIPAGLTPPAEQADGQRATDSFREPDPLS